MTDFATSFERLTESRNARIAAAVVAAVVLLTSGGLLAASKVEPARSKKVAVLPDAPLDIPVLRSWPYPDTRVAELTSLRVSKGRIDAPVKGRLTLTARR